MWIKREEYESLHAQARAAQLVNIERAGRENVFTFLKDGKQVQIRTMGLLSDDINAWKRELIG